MSSNPMKCSVCGGTMYRVKVLPSKLAGLNRFRCPCGHCEDLKENRPSVTQQRSPSTVTLDS